jgi:RNA polymerase sigma factor (sigma-70 family)
MSETFDNSRIEQLCRKAQTGDLSAEQELFKNLTDSFRIFAQHRIRDQADAEEVVQDALAIVAQKYKETAFVSSFAGWAHNILRNTMSSHIRQKVSRARLRPQAESAMANVVNRQVPDEVRRKVLACLKEVARSNRRFARVINLHYQGFTSTEICSRLGLTREYFYVVLARARSALESCLGIAKD